jgi:hypothetical protein
VFLFPFRQQLLLGVVEGRPIFFAYRGILQVELGDAADENPTESQHCGIRLLPQDTGDTYFGTDQGGKH